MRIRTVALLFPLLVAACVPERDNPLDPARAPVGALTVRSLGVLPWEECRNLFNTGTHGDLVLVASRGACLTLDASASDDPQEDPLDYRFTLPGVEEPIDSDGPVLLLDSSSSYRQSLSLGQPALSFAVRVEDPGGAFDVATAPLELTNSPPVAVVAPARSLPAGGFPWAPGQAMSAPFDGSGSNDPDGDPLFFEWTLPDGATSTLETAPWSAPIVAGSHRATLRVRDGDASDPRTLFSRLASTFVRVGAPHLWGQESGVGVQRFDAVEPMTFDAARRVSNAVFIGATASAPTAHIAYTRFTNGPSSVAVVSYPEGVECDSISVTNSTTALGAAPGTRRFWVVDDIAVGVSQLSAYDVAANGTLTVAAGPFPIAPALGGSIGVASDGSAWFGTIESNLGSDLVRATTAGVELLPAPPNDLLTYGVLPRPDTDEMWELQSLRTFGETAVRSRIVVWSAGGTPVREIELPGAVMSRLAWTGTDSFWATDLGTGLRLVDATLLEAGRSLDEATIHRVDDTSPFANGFVADPTNGSVYWEIDEATVLTFPDGQTRVFGDDAIRGRPYFLDPDGGLWFADVSASIGAPMGLHRAGSLDPSGKILGDEPFSTSPPVYDWTTGWTWIYSYVPSGPAKLAADGTRQRLFTEAVVDGVRRPFPFLQSTLRVTPDGATAWGEVLDFDTFELTSMVRFDFTGEIPVGQTVPTGLSTTQLGNLLSTAVPSPPADFLWALQGSSGNYILGTIPPEGPFTSRFTFPQLALGARLFAPAPQSARVCAGWIEGANMLRLRWISEDGTLSTLADMPVSNATLKILATSPDGAGGEACWVFFHDGFDQDLSMLAFTAAGPAARTYASPGDEAILSAFPIDLDEVWLTANDPDTQAPPTRRVHLVYDGGWTRTERPAPDQLRLAAPFSMP